MTEIILNENQRKLRKMLEKLLNDLKEDTYEHNFSSAQRQKKISDMADIAHQLHISLKDEAREPRHHKYMIKNRGLSPDHRDFYKHIHPVEDLLAFIDDENSNDDPFDLTIDITFKMQIYSRRWGHTDTYRFIRIEEGWNVSLLSRSGSCDKKGYPVFYEILDNDLINYPAELPNYMGWLWDSAKEKGLTKEEVQSSLDDIAKWINSCEKSSPKGIFKGFK
ncbi:hypothetical protein H9649_11310 [Sporosarcina sp. Sa2YVA2]|uniref:Integron cassette protein domain-containing protein n=1 Tax=Sporosarcina quadrami TaxID=2762234 RepID=A0ABR8UAX3_9BACL|nr:hypothetical protein [Sporosarcina quadrami]MBD7985178.1 hypothetical protein [Sporosarcina quadrami]